MKQPKFRDAHRFPHGAYVPSGSTDIRATFARVREQQEANKREAEAKVARIQRRSR